MPTIEFSLAATQYGKERNVPVVLDLRDMWPDIFLDVAPKVLRPLARMVLWPMDTSLRKACKNATALFGITEEFLEWGLQKAGRPRNGLDAVFHHAYKVPQLSHESMQEAEKFWRRHGIEGSTTDFIVCFFGYFGRQFDLDAVIDSAWMLKDHPHIRFVLCGNGDSFERYRKKVEGLTNVVLPGFVGQAEIAALMRMARVGLAPYLNKTDFNFSIPNKIGEYLSAGLPIVSSMKGTVERLLAVYGCGVTYPSGNAAALAECLNHLSRDGSRLQQMSANAAALFAEKFDAAKVYSAMADRLDAVVIDYRQRSHC
jgi:glycosyltransferase involved in cell wall biosynthesis